MIVTHCEDTPTIKVLEDEARAKWGEDVPMREHGRIRSADACYKSSSLAVSWPSSTAPSCVLHLTTAKELSLFTATPDLKDLRTRTSPPRCAFTICSSTRWTTTPWAARSSATRR